MGLYSHELSAETLVRSLRITKLLVNCEELGVLERALGVISISSLLRFGVKSLGKLIDELGCGHVRVPTKGGSGRTAGDCGMNFGYRRINEFDAVVRNVVVVGADVVITNVAGADTLVDEAVDELCPLDLRRTVCVSRGLLRLDKLSKPVRTQYKMTIHNAPA
jgi:hypothetical protein